MFEKLMEEFEKHDNARENVIIGSRGIIKLSKKIISAVHKGDMDKAKDYVKDIEAEVKNLSSQKDIANTGSFGNALQEYIEAILFFEYSQNHKIMGYDEFAADITPEDYINGLCDFVGELQRRAVIFVSRSDREEIKKIYDDVTEIYDGLLDFSLRGQSRKKFDLVKYVMVRLEEIMLKIKLK